MAIQKTTWTKSKGKSGANLPPLTTDDGPTTNTNWHRVNMAEGVTPEAPWTVTWDTSRHADSFNTAQDKTQSAALDRARQMLRMNFIVYKICEPSGAVFLGEAEIMERLGTKPVAKETPRLPPTHSREMV